MVHKNNIVDVIGEVAAEIGVDYLYGSIPEITKRLALKDRIQQQKYPLLWLVTDVTGTREKKGYLYSVALYLFAYSNPNYTSVERTETTFTPVLYPLQNAFLNAVKKNVHTSVENDPKHKSTDMYFYGRSENKENVFADFLDAIEIKDLEIFIYDKKC